MSAFLFPGQVTIAGVAAIRSSSFVENTFCGISPAFTTSTDLSSPHR